MTSRVHINGIDIKVTNSGQLYVNGKRIDQNATSNDATCEYVKVFFMGVAVGSALAALSFLIQVG